MEESGAQHVRMSMRSDTNFFNIEINGTDEPKVTTIKLRHGKSFFDFAFDDESDGTRRLFDLMDMLLMTSDDTVFIIDELERSLHPKLTERFLQLFNEIHKDRKVQLIFTTHEAAIMDQELFRRDEIWFVERSENNASSVYSLDRFKERYDKVLSKAYLEGRYGAIPVFKSFEWGEE
jgi:AAA15 family ATPase/GTPase